MKSQRSSTTAPDWLGTSSGNKTYAAYAAAVVASAFVFAQVNDNFTKPAPQTLSEKPLTDVPKYLVSSTGFTGSVSKEIGNWINKQQLGFAAVDHLVTTIMSVFGKVEITPSIHSDQDEGWEKMVLSVNSGIEDYDEVMSLEDKLFEKIDQDAALRRLLKSVVITQV